MSSRPPLLNLALAVLAVGALTGCSAASAAGANPTVPVALTHPRASAATSSAPALPSRLPGLGPQTLAQVPADANQVVVVLGAGINAPTSTVVFYQHTAAGWQAEATWAAHNGLDGWSAEHMNNDLRSPIGVFTLTDAGGLLPNPGSKLPYYQSYGFTNHGTGFDGESLAGAFDYVVAINYNRKPGTSPLDWTMPLGGSRGGQIWFHVDHGGPTHGCVSLPEADMLTLLHTLDPAQNPVVVMGDSDSLSH